MVQLHLVTPLPIRVSGFSTCRLRLTLFFPEICRIASVRKPTAEIFSGGSMEAEMKFHACICGPMSFDWHGSISPESGLAFLRA